MTSRRRLLATMRTMGAAALDPPDGPTRPALSEAPARSDQRVHVEFEGHDHELVVSGIPEHLGCTSVRPLAGGLRSPASVALLRLPGFGRS